jgi:hypothetical protein
VTWVTQMWHGKEIGFFKRRVHHYNRKGRLKDRCRKVNYNCPHGPGINQGERYAPILKHIYKNRNKHASRNSPEQ